MKAMGVATIAWLPKLSPATVHAIIGVPGKSVLSLPKATEKNQRHPQLCSQAKTA